MWNELRLVLYGAGIGWRCGESALDHTCPQGTPSNDHILRSGLPPPSPASTFCAVAGASLSRSRSLSVARSLSLSRCTGRASAGGAASPRSTTPAEQGTPSNVECWYTKESSVIYDSGLVSLEHVLLSRSLSQTQDHNLASTVLLCRPPLFGGATSPRSTTPAVWC